MKNIPKQIQTPAARESKIGVGLDFGTSNSSIAIYDGTSLHLVSFKHGDGEADVIPTAIYVTRKQKTSIGHQAIQDYLKNEAGRVIRLTREQVGKFEFVVAGTEASKGQDDGAITVQADVHTFTDQEMPGRLFRSLKRWLGSSVAREIKIFEKSWRLQDLLVQILLFLKGECSEAGVDLPSLPIHCGHPVEFEGISTQGNQVAFFRLKEAFILAGLKEPVFYPEPVAASLSFLRSERPKTGEIILTFDFGGGTLDLCILKTTAHSFEIMGTHGIGLGGDELDRLIFEKKLFPELGESAVLTVEGGDPPRTARFPFHEFSNKLLNWQLTYELNRPELRGYIRRGIEQGGESAIQLERLRVLIASNLSYRVFQAIEKAKVELSSRDASTIQIPELDLCVSITRDEFESMLTEPLQQMEDCVHAVLMRAGISGKEVSRAVCTGGSSKIPVVQQHLAKLLACPLHEHDAFTSIAAGLAIANFHGYPP